MMMATSYNNRSVDITHNQTTKITPMKQNGFGLGFLKHLLYFSRRHKLFVCLLLVTESESHAQRETLGAETPSWVELLDKQFGMF